MICYIFDHAHSMSSFLIYYFHIRFLKAILATLFYLLLYFMFWFEFVTCFNIFEWFLFFKIYGIPWCSSIIITLTCLEVWSKKFVITITWGFVNNVFSPLNFAMGNMLHIMFDNNQVVDMFRHGVWIKFGFCVTLIFQNPLNLCVFSVSFKIYKSWGKVCNQILPKAGIILEVLIHYGEKFKLDHQSHNWWILFVSMHFYLFNSNKYFQPR